MGTGHIIQCDNCSYLVHFANGVGMNHPLVCKETLEDMRKGRLGEEFQKAANSIRHPAVELSPELYVCPQCGELEQETKISLCAPIVKFTPRDIIFSSACEGVEGCDYVFDEDIGTRYDVVVTMRHICEKCNVEKYRVPMERISELECPRCKGTLKLRSDNRFMFWD